LRIPFAVSLAIREGRSSARRLATYMIAITVGVAALVAINSFRANVVQSVDEESKSLLGGDMRINASQAFPDSVTALLDSLERTSPGSTARVASTVTLALAKDGTPKLVQLRGVYGPYPFYGTMDTDPLNRWSSLGSGRRVLVEPTLLTQMNTVVGDSLRIGGMQFLIAGTITNLPAEVTFRNALGPRVFMAGAMLDKTKLLSYGSIARYEAYVKMPDDAVLQRFVDMHDDFLHRSMVGVTTAKDQAQQLAKALDALGRFLGLVGLAALLLGGLGVASAINVFIKSRRDTIAVLRCLGATQRTAFTAYLLQSVVLGVVGAFIGVLLGIAIQLVLPAVFKNALPFDVHIHVEWMVLLTGLLIGAAVTTVFALLPLLEIRGITPLRALRHSLEPGSVTDPARVIVYLLLLAAVAGLSVWQAGRLRIGLAYAGGLAVVLLILWICAASLSRLTRSLFPRHASFPVRQGVANLYRPQNQTLAVIMAVGFGMFLLSGLWVVQRNILDWIQLDKGSESRPNLVLIDIQPDQAADTRALIARYTSTQPELTPIVPGKIAAVNGKSAAELVSFANTGRRERNAGARGDDSRGRNGVEPWAIRREYRHTYRAKPTDSEKITSGKWWSGPYKSGTIAEISVEDGLMQNIGAKLGDHITWDIQGAQIETVITSTRSVDWARFDTNFFVVFQTGVLENAPQSDVALVTVDPAKMGFLQRDIALAHANISAIDIGSVQKTLDRIVSRVAFAVRTMALFSVIAGALVLLAALAAGRHQRVRESALLRVLGATRKQLRRMLMTEYIALGLLAGFTGILLGSVAGWALIRFVFELPKALSNNGFTLPVFSLLAMWIAVAVMSALMGLYTSRDALGGTPLEVLREV
jgi:putative ABC transport system permease protein